MIQIRHLGKVYATSTPLYDINANIESGEVISLIGPSGTGKSTLLRCINLLEKPTHGSICIDGQETLKPSCNIYSLRRKVGMVFQSFNLFQHLTAIENIMQPQIDLLKKNRQEAYDYSVQLLNKVGLVDSALKYSDELSGGQKQRIAIARALAIKPTIILFDEPTSALDPTMIGEVQAIIRDLIGVGITMIIATHEMDFARSISNRIFFMNNGIIQEEGTPEQIFTNPKNELTKQFIYKLKVLEFELKNNTSDIPGIYTSIAGYCRKNRIPPKMEMYIRLVFEEFIQQILMIELKKSNIHFKLDYCEAENSANVIIEYEGTPINLEVIKNKLSLTIIKSTVSSLYCQADPQKLKNRIDLLLNN